MEDANRIDVLKYKVQTNFDAIHYIFLLLFPIIYSRTNNFGIQKESNFEFVSSTWKTRKQNNETLDPKIVNELPAPTYPILITDTLSKAKNPKYHQNREVNEFQQTPLYLEKTRVPVLDHSNAPIAPEPKYRMTAETVEIKKEMGIDKPDGGKISTKMDGSSKKLWTQQRLLEQLREGMKEKKFC